MRTKPTTLDGFPAQNNINFLPKLWPELNAWSIGKKITVPVLDFWINMRPVAWKGTMINVEYELFTGLVKQSMEGDLTVLAKFRKRRGKEEVLDELFEMAVA